MCRLMRWCKEELWKWALLVLGVVIAMSLLSGCKTTKYVPLEKVVYRESVRCDTLHKRDSIYVHDSVFMSQKGDTVFCDRWHKETFVKEIYKNKTDSFISRDSISVPYPVEKDLSKWEQFQLKYAIWSFGALCMIIVCFCIKLYRRFKNDNRQHINQQK